MGREIPTIWRAGAGGKGTGPKEDSDDDSSHDYTARCTDA